MAESPLSVSISAASAAAKKKTHLDDLIDQELNQSRQLIKLADEYALALKRVGFTDRCAEKFNALAG